MRWSPLLYVLLLGICEWNALSPIGTRVTKCAEGLHNKAFILEMDNGSEVFAKLPNPNAGPAHLTVSSEVATRELVRRPVSHEPRPYL
jgi:hypothetical protein